MTSSSDAGTAPDPGPGGRTAADVMTAGPRTCSPFSTVTEAALLFRDHDCGAVPVLDGGKPVGILTDRDVALAAARFPDLPSRPVSDVMTAGVITVPADADLAAVKAAFVGGQVRRLLVVDPGGLLVGIIAWSDIVPNLPAGDVGRVVSGVVDRPAADDPRPPGAVGVPGPGGRAPGA